MVSLFAFLAAVVAQTPDAVYLNGKIVTVDPRFSIAEAMAIREGRFTAVGKNGEIQKLAGPSTRVIDLHNKTVVPGFEDSHLHSAGGGPGVDLSNARSFADIFAAIRERVRSSKPGDAIVHFRSGERGSRVYWVATAAQGATVQSSS